jgi:hypothetical protein
MRNWEAIWIVLKVIAGRTKWRRLPTPIEGNNLRLRENMICISIANQNAGMLEKVRAKTRVTVSMGLFCWTAATIPNEIPKTVVIRRETTANVKV